MTTADLYDEYIQLDDYDKLAFCQIDTLPEIKKGKFADLLYESAASRGIPLENALNEWMKWNIELFDVEYYLNDKWYLRKEI